VQLALDARGQQLDTGRWPARPAYRGCDLSVRARAVAASLSCSRPSRPAADATRQQQVGSRRPWLAPAASRLHRATAVQGCRRWGRSRRPERRAVLVQARRHAHRLERARHRAHGANAPSWSGITVSRGPRWPPFWSVAARPRIRGHLGRKDEPVGAETADRAARGPEHRRRRSPADRENSSGGAQIHEPLGCGLRRAPWRRSAARHGRRSSNASQIELEVLVGAHPRRDAIG